MNWQNATHLLHCGHSAITRLARPSIFPLGALLIVVAFNLFGDAQRNATDVRLKEM
jgi:ABC-type dipeptide/oligopeptide/nickel transport system permease subunit